MSEPKLISPMLDNFAMGDPISEHNGVRCCPAMENDTDNRYIVKIISVPASPNQLDALLLTGAFSGKEDALNYFKSLTDDVTEEVQILNRLSQLEGFLPFQNHQVVPMDDGTGYDIYLLSSYKRTLEKQFHRNPLSHLGAVNLGLDLCAALTVCRRSGYLYVDLKPKNIFVTVDQEYRIGDLGFINLNSLQYASLPEKYRSAYTAPEITDAFSSLNTTLDIYALGLILYQVYNNGELPFKSEVAPSEEFPAPMYADYEMSEIILKACAPNPQDRWQSPIEMGQALVSYMQRNGVNDTPIVPPVLPISESDDQPAESSVVDEEATEQTDDALDTSENIEIQNEEPEIIDAPSSADEANESTLSASAESGILLDSDNEDDFENLSFLSDDDMSISEEDLLQYNAITPEVSEMLEQADDLAAHAVPLPAVAPDPIEIPMPEPIEQFESDNIENEVADTVQETLEEVDHSEQDKETEPDTPKRKKHRVRNFFIWLIILGLLAGAAYMFRSYYIITIDSIELDGKEDTLSVFVKTDINESILSVVCSDAHGNQHTEPVIDGVATFTGLVPSTGYNIKVVVSGFHRITGDASTAYSTPVQTSIVQFNAVTGSEDGSVILGFTVDGPDSEQWHVYYSAEGEEEQVATFPSHMVTLTGLTVGKVYTFRLVPETQLYLTGSNEMQFKASNLVYAEDLIITSCADNTLTVTWKEPSNTNVDSWTVRCYNDDAYNETIITSETTATFENLDHTGSFTVEVTAAGMSVSQRTFVGENTITLSNVQFDHTDPTKLLVSWNSSIEVANGWLITYTIDGSELQEAICTENNIEIFPVVPGATYQFTLQDIDGSPIIGSQFAYTVADSEAFNCNYEGYEITQEHLVFSMCKTPSDPNWNRYYLRASDYTTTFNVGQKASFLVRLTKSYGTSDDVIVTTFVIRDSDNKVVIISSQESTWTNMWYRNYGEIDIPTLPEAAGDYTIDIFFNGAIAASQSFTII